MTTAEILMGMTDSASFESLGNVVLRVKYPHLTNLIASGINAKGKTIKGPVDAFASIGKNHFARIAYTTNETNLERKWLNENVTDRSPAGDLITLVEFAEQKKLKEPEAEVFIYLVTNQPVSPELDEKVRAKVCKDFITLEILENSNLAGFLDYDATGQYLRKKFLHIDAELLSEPLLKDLMEKNFSNYSVEIFMHQRELLETTITKELQKEVRSLSSKLGLIIGESGGGKSTAVLATMRTYLDQGHNALRIDPQILTVSDGIYSAIEKQLLKEYSKLFVQRDAIQHFFNGECLIVVDDINKQENSGNLLEKLISWMQVENNRENQMIILCPVWPKNLSALENAIAKEQLYQVIKLNRLSRKDAVSFLRQILNKSSLNLSDPEIDTILKETKDDPLLLTLYADQIIAQNRYVPNQGQEVISRFIDERLQATASGIPVPEIKVKSVLEKLGFQMLTKRSLNPGYKELERWFQNDSSAMQIFNATASHKTLFYVDRNGVLIFRHDRVRDYILIFTLQSLLVRLTEHIEIIQDPFYAELVGTALSRTDLSENDIDALMNLNPLAVYYSLKFLQENASASRRRKIEKSILNWNSGLKDRPINAALIRAISFSLIGFDIQNSEEITQGLGESIEINLARFRNGIAEGGIKFFMHQHWFSPTFGNYWRDMVLDHVHKNHYEKVLKRTQYLLGAQLRENARPKIYLLAGYLRSPILISGLRNQWFQNKKEEDLLYYLWAIINCFDADNVSFLTEALDMWAALEENWDRSNIKIGSKKDIFLELSRSRWEFREEQIVVLVKLLSNPDYSRLIYAIIDYVDSPLALEAVVKKMASDREKRGDDWISVSKSSEDRWDFEKRKEKLSKESLSSLLAFWKNSGHKDKERYFAFRFWCGNEVPQKVIEELRNVQKKEISIYDSSLFWRTRLGDPTVMNQLAELIGRKWWAIRNLDKIWNEEAKLFFKDWFGQAIRSRHGDRLGDALELLRKINRPDAEEILVEYWEAIRLMHTGFLTALYIATPKTRELARQEINRLGFNKWETIKDYYRGPSEGYFILSDEVGNLPDDLKQRASFLAEEFRYAYFNYGYFSDHEKRKLSLEELDSLLPYLSLIDKHGLGEFAEQCQRHGYNVWLEQHLYSLLSDSDKKKFRPTNDDIADELTDYLSNTQQRDITEFVNRLHKRGVHSRRFIESLKTFSNRHNSFEGFYLLCKCLEEIGSRMDLDLLESYHVANATDRDKIGKLKENTIFTVSRKSLQ